MWESLEKANDLLQLSVNQKKEIVDACDDADRYYHNMASGTYNVLPDDKVLQILPQTLPFTNHIPFGMRIWMSVFMGAPFSVECIPAGARDPMGLKKMVADALNYVNQATRQTPEHKSLMRRFGTQAMLYNQVAIYDGLKKDKTPFYQLINWRDLYIDPAASEPMNDTGGPRWIGVRTWLYEDQKKRLYGSRKMRSGIEDGDPYATKQDREVYKDLYPVIHWWGFDESDYRISRERVADAINQLWDPIIQGQALQIMDQEPHRTVAEEGDKKFVTWINEQTGSSIDPESENPIDAAVRRGTETGLSVPLDNYLSWRQYHLGKIDEDNEGRKIDKYKTGVYRCEFQESGEILLDPEESPFKHGQLPISTACRHEGTMSYWTKGILAEALHLQRYVEYLEANRDIHLGLQSRPFLYAITEFMADRYRDPDTGQQKFIDDLREGMKVMFLRNLPQGMDPSKLFGYISPGAISLDVKMTLQEKTQSLMELFGASEVMRGMGPGAEASGKHIQLKMEAASRPSTFMSQLLESPIHRHFERYDSNILEFAPPEWLGKLCNQEQVQAIMQLRQSGDMNFLTKVQLGAGMPTEWVDRFGIYSQLIKLGWPVSPQTKMLTKEMGIPGPSDSEIQAAFPPVMPGQPGAVPSGPPQPGQVPGGAPKMPVNKGA